MVNSVLKLTILCVRTAFRIIIYKTRTIQTSGETRKFKIMLTTHGHTISLSTLFIGKSYKLNVPKRKVFDNPLLPSH